MTCNAKAGYWYIQSGRSQCKAVRFAIAVTGQCPLEKPVDGFQTLFFRLGKQWVLWLWNSPKLRVLLHPKSVLLLEKTGLWAKKSKHYCRMTPPFSEAIAILMPLSKT